MQARIALAILLLGCAAFAQNQKDHPALLPGTWKVNLAKSKLGFDLKEGVMTITQAGPDRFNIHVEEVRSSGQKTSRGYTRICDGQEHQSTASQTEDPKYTEICTKQGDEVTLKYDGQTMSTMHLTWSVDGDMHIVNQKGIHRDGQPFETLVVFDRVK